MRPNERLDSTSTIFGKRLDLTGEVTVSFFNELDTGKELCSRPLFHFLTSFPQRRETILIVASRSWLPRGQCSGRTPCQGTKVGHGF
jgi:hypothetical protein